MATKDSVAVHGPDDYSQPGRPGNENQRKYRSDLLGRKCIRSRNQKSPITSQEEVIGQLSFKVLESKFT